MLIARYLRYLAPNLQHSINIYNLAALWLVGRGRIGEDIDQELLDLPKVRHIPWDLISSVRDI